MRLVTIAFVLALAACGSKNPKAGDGDTLPDDLRSNGNGDPPPQTELEKRQGAACEELGPKLTECAIADARATMSPDELAKLDVENTGKIHTREFVKSCKAQTMSSRQVRVYEVCMREETECGALTACLENASPKAEGTE
jgi:predicted small lipoprotein YifL